jgi:hypothetical protein
MAVLPVKVELKILAYIVEFSLLQVNRAPPPPTAPFAVLPMKMELVILIYRTPLVLGEANNPPPPLDAVLFVKLEPIILI